MPKVATLLSVLVLVPLFGLQVAPIGTSDRLAMVDDPIQALGDPYSAYLTEEEYRKLFDLRRAYEDEQGAIADNSDPEKMRRRSEARQLLEEGYKTALGEDRNKEVQRQMDPSWRGLTEIGQQFNLPQSVLEQAYTYQRTASEQISALFSNPGITGEDRRNAIREINEATKQQMEALLGAGPYAQLRQSSPQVYYSSGGGDAVVFSGPVPAAPIRAGERITTTVGDRLNTEIRTLVNPAR